MKKIFPRFTFFLLADLFSFWLFSGYALAILLTAPAQKQYSFPEQIAGCGLREIMLMSSDGTKIHAWVAGDDPQKKAVILIPGIRGNSSSMIGRAAIYLRNNYAVLMPDLRATGRSGGNVISFGWNERHDLLACYRWLKAQGYESIGVHGCSLGAATIAYSLDSIRDYNFMIMESCYDNIDHAFAHRTFDSGFNRFLFWPVYSLTERRTGAAPDILAPADRFRLYSGPLLYFAGNRETQIPLEETVIIFKKFPGMNKTLRIFEGAPHCDLLAFAPEAYTQALSSFIRNNKQP